MSTERMWSVLTNAFSQDPIYQSIDSRTIISENEQAPNQISMVGKIQLVNLKVVLPADFEYDPN